ncbi:DgyrCDS2458 [Dimorphilus gyrociliatus]|uniref:DgyrCDS2458 n=1 Tax=Dimorphilus gyrociliatus TaxID=2664684 RepID=A0A7I8VAD8_9ANNE|nr:DgyrCDS2458 [Dimorphilus gyrociliatus]
MSRSLNTLLRRRLTRKYLTAHRFKSHFDLIVLGGGSGGLACSKAAAKFTDRVCVIDFVRPSPVGNTWGLGGTCVNVGCIPKKLMHQAALIGDAIDDSSSYGWELHGKINHNWDSLVSNVQQHIKQLNWNHRVDLRSKKVQYKNAKGMFVSSDTLRLTKQNGEKEEISGEKIVIAVGGRPTYPNIEGAIECCITSDDIFSLSKPPGKTLVIGASSDCKLTIFPLDVGLEIAGFLNGLGYETSLMVRSIPLRGFDIQCASLVMQNLSNRGITILEKKIPKRFYLNNSSKVVVYESQDGKEVEESFDTIVLATGRTADTSGLGLEKIGVELDENKKVIGNFGGEFERTSIDNIYAIGDILKGGVELTPVAIKAGKLLAKRLFDEGTEHMDYKGIPTTVFTPLEYSCCGLAEESAISQYGNDSIEVYHAFYRPLEFILSNKRHQECYIKMIVNKADNDRILGLHFLGPHSGEVMQGFAAAIKSGVTLQGIEGTVGIHPTCAEEIVKLNITKRSGLDPTVTEC